MLLQALTSDHLLKIVDLFPGPKKVKISEVRFPRRFSIGGECYHCLVSLPSVQENVAYTTFDEEGRSVILFSLTHCRTLSRGSPTRAAASRVTTRFCSQRSSTSVAIYTTP